MVRAEFLKILKAGEEGGSLSFEEIRFLLTAGKKEETLLLETANRVRRKFVGEAVHLRAIIEFSNHCRQNCLYCGLRRDNRRLVRYRMTPREIERAAERAAAEGYKTAVLQSGEDLWFTRNRLADLIGRIKAKTGLAITLSLGERSRQDYRAWKKAGADRFLLKFETSSPGLYRWLRPGLELNDRLDSLQSLQDLGYEVGSGNIVGLPEQTAEDLARDIELCKTRNFDMLGIGPLIVHPETPLAGRTGGDVRQTLRVLAVTRIITRDTNLPATTALGVTGSQGRRKALLAGANVLMPDVTPEEYRQNYEIYPGKTRPPIDMEAIVSLIRSVARVISEDCGFRPGGPRPPLSKS